ncbi:uncharacterized protein VTP21DRAFT_1659 [Calcarisporiella thermophila]|uniref:uncharacterized protein n=1 Tax=Calcarisporiella thermophila TaxID=911321 RepID=UPI0037435E99
MNSLHNHTLKQLHAIQRDLAKFESGEDRSAGLQGQITAGFSTLKRSIDDFESMARREMIAVKREKALNQVAKFRDEFQDSKLKFEQLKKDESKEAMTRDRQELLERRRSRQTFVMAEHPYQSPAMNHTLREHSFVNSTEQQLDSFISRAQDVLEDLRGQHGILKSTQRKMLDAANTLGLSGSVIRYIERRTTEDKWIFLGGIVITILIMWAIWYYLQ